MMDSYYKVPREVLKYLQSGFRSEPMRGGLRASDYVTIEMQGSSDVFQIAFNINGNRAWVIFFTPVD